MEMPQKERPPQGAIDVDAIIDKIQIPPNLKSFYDKAVLSGMRIMFDKSSHQMFLDQISKEGPMADKIAEGIITLIYMLWTQSNKTLPPQILAPLTVTMTLKAFEYLQKSGNPEATKEVLGEAMEKAVLGVAERVGVPREKMEQAMAQSGGMPAGGGLIQQGAANGA